MTIGDEKVVERFSLDGYGGWMEQDDLDGDYVLHSAYAEMAAERDSAVSQARTTQWLLDQALETIKFNGKFTEALANDLKAAGVRFSNENGVTITNERAQAAESQLAELRGRLEGLASGYAAEAERHLMHAANKDWAEWVRAGHSSRASELNGAAREIRALAVANGTTTGEMK